GRTADAMISARKMGITTSFNCSETYTTPIATSSTSSACPQRVASRPNESLQRYLGDPVRSTFWAVVSSAGRGVGLFRRKRMPPRYRAGRHPLLPLACDNEDPVGALAVAAAVRGARTGQFLHAAVGGAVLRERDRIRHGRGGTHHRGNDGL